MGKHCTNYSTKITTVPAPQKSRLYHSKYIHNFFTVHKTSQEAENVPHLHKKICKGLHTKHCASEHTKTDIMSDYILLFLILSAFFCYLNIHYTDHIWLYF